MCVFVYTGGNIYIYILVEPTQKFSKQVKSINFWYNDLFIP